VASRTHDDLKDQIVGLTSAVRTTMQEHQDLATEMQDLKQRNKAFGRFSGFWRPFGSFGRSLVDFGRVSLKIRENATKIAPAKVTGQKSACAAPLGSSI